MDWTTALIAAASEARLRSGFGGATTSYPEVTSSRLMPAKPDASANAPWTRTTVGLGESVMRSLLVTRLSPTLARRGPSRSLPRSGDCPRPRPMVPGQRPGAPPHAGPGPDPGHGDPGGD